MTEAAPEVAVDAPAAAEPAPAAPTPVAPPSEPASTPAEPTPVEAPAEQPAADNWRTRMANGDDKRLSRLERYGSEEAVADALFAAQQKISSGDMLPKLGDNPSDDELAAYRKDMGIPETAEGYEYKLPEGFTFGEADKPYLDKMLKGMHAQNATPGQIDTMLNLYAQNLEEEALQHQARDTSDREATEDALRNEYGNEYRANVNMVQNFLSTAPEDVQSMLLNGRGPDGTAFMNSPEMVRWLNGVVREVNPAASVVKMTGRDTMANVNDEIKSLKADMDADINAWHKAPDKKARYQTLLSAKEKMEARKA